MRNRFRIMFALWTVTFLMTVQIAATDTPAAVAKSKAVADSLARHDKAVDKAQRVYREAVVTAKKRALTSIRLQHKKAVRLKDKAEATAIKVIVDRLDTEVKQLEALLKPKDPGKIVPRQILLEKAKASLSPEKYKIAGKLRFAGFKAATYHLGEGYYTRSKIHVRNDSSRAQITARVRATIKYLLVTGDRKPVVMSYASYLKIASKGVHVAEMRGSQRNKTVMFNNAGKAVPHNAYIGITYDGILVYEALWKPRDRTATYKANKDILWFRDASLIKK